MDIVCPKGWYKGALQGKKISFTWVPWPSGMALDSASVPILVVDINEDGKNDIVWGMGHGYGLYWAEHTSTNDGIHWIQHEIDLSWSQPHYLAYVDLDGDGQYELITGKRVFAHNGKDPGGTDDPCIYVYQYDKEAKDWRRQTVSFGESVGFGLNPAIADIDQDGDLDIICPGKSGLYIMKQK